MKEDINTQNIEMTSIDFNSAFEELPLEQEKKNISISDGLVYSLKNKGKVDVYYISEITGTTPLDVVTTLRGTIYKDPEEVTDDRYEGYVTKDQYLNGNLLHKLQVAKEVNFYALIYDDNIRLLKEKIRERNIVDSDEIFVTLGSPWVPVEYIEQFIRHLLFSELRWKPFLRVSRSTRNGLWKVESSYGLLSLANYSTYGTREDTAISLIQKTLNQVEIVYYDYTYVNGVRTRVKNQSKTLELLEKQRLILEEFRKWIFVDKDRKKKVTDIYNNTYCTNFTQEYDGSFLDFPDLNPEVKLYDYQRNAVARIILGKNTLLAHDVGSGKTYEMICAAHELHRMGLSKKTMIVVPNDILVQWENLYKYLYPSAHIMVVYPKDFTPAKREFTLLRMRDECFEAILIGYSSFDMLHLSPEFRKRDLKEILRVSYQNVGLLANAKFLDSLDKKYGFNNPEEIYFEDLGINYFFLDECQNYKNITIRTNINAIGVNTSGSDKCDEMYAKVRLIQRNNGGKGIVFASGTPITNSISDIYVIQKCLQEAELAFLGLSHFNSWICSFAEKVERFEVDVDTSNYRLVSRYVDFQNLPELAALLSSIADFHMIDKEKELPSFNGYVDVKIAPTKEFLNFLEDISARADLVRSRRPRIIKPAEHKVDEVKDNMLVITTDGRKGALDIRLVDENASFSKNSKVYECAKRVFFIYQEYNNVLGTQLVFCDTSTPKDGFNVYDELKRLLISFGIKDDEIAYIQTANTKAKRDALFKKVNKGLVRVVIGSSSKLATGVNVQERLIAIHHIDVPWRPSDMVQREGRILRQGNTNKEVFIYRYITEKSFDAYSWQILENKQTFISSLLSNELINRDSKDLEENVLSYAEVKALAVGDPRIKLRVETANSISRLKILSNAFNKEREKTIAEMNNIKNYHSQWKNHYKNTHEDYLFGQKEENAKIEDEEKRKLIRGEIYQHIVNNMYNTYEEDIGAYRGFRIITPSYQLNGKDQYVYLEHLNRYKLTIGDSVVGFLTRIDNFIDGLDKVHEEEVKSYRSKIKLYKDGEVFLQKPNPYTSEIADLTRKLEAIDKDLGIKKKEK